MKNRYYVIGLLMLLTTFYSATASDLGYEFLDNNSVFHMWNLHDDYYFNVSNGLQYSNYYDEYWTRNTFCLGFNAADSWTKIKCVSELSNFNKILDSDNESYVNITLWKDFVYSDYTLRIANIYYLGVDDKELQIKPYIKNIGSQDITQNIGFAWKIDQITIDNDLNDWIEIDGNNYNLSNDSIDLMFQDMHIPFFRLYDTSYIQLRWDAGLNYKVFLNTTNEPKVTLFINAGSLSIGQEKSTTIYWRDPAVYWIYQEVANTSLFNTDGSDEGSCQTWANVNDTNYGTNGFAQNVASGTRNCWQYENYTILDSYVGAKYQTKCGFPVAITNSSIPSDCYDGDVNTLVLRFLSEEVGAGTKKSHFYCRNSTDWRTLRTCTGSADSRRVYETGVFWEILNTPPNITNISITSTPIIDDDLHCSYNPNDGDSDQVNVSVTWWQNISGSITQNTSYDYVEVNPTLGVSSTTTAGTGSFTGSTSNGSAYLCQLNISDSFNSSLYNSSWTTVQYITSNISFYSGSQTQDFDVLIRHGMGSGVTCAVETNDTQYQCGEEISSSPLTISCDNNYIDGFIIVNFSPYCENSSIKLYSESQDVTFNYNGTINITVYNLDTQEVITDENISINLLIQAANFNLDTNTDNNTGSVVISNIPIGDLIITSTSENYLTSSITHTISISSTNYNISVYLVNSSDANAGKLFVNTFNQDYYAIKNADTRLQQYFTDIGDFVEVQQCFSDSNGECVFNIILADKRYRITTQATINGITSTAISSEIGNYYPVDNTEIELYLSFKDEFTAPDDYGLSVTAFNTILDGNTSDLYASFIDIYGNTHEVCLGYYYNDGFNKILGQEECTNGSSGTVGFGSSYVLNRDFTWTAEIYTKLNSSRFKTYESYRYNRLQSFEQEYSDFLNPIIILIMALLLGFAVQLKNILIFPIGMIPTMLIYLIIKPDVFTPVVSAIIIFFCVMLIYIGRKRSDNEAT